MPIGRTSSTLTKPLETVREWYHVDAADQILGRLAANLARRLMGKHKPSFTPYVDNGDFIVVTNADKLRLSGRKPEQKYYRRYSGYPGGYKEETYKSLSERRPERVLELAVKRMLPKSALGQNMLKKLKVYRGETHNHAAQNPKSLTF
jgi:large subunit ribosomal protein L13